MRGEQLVMFIHADLVGIARGRAIPATDLSDRLRDGVSWVPANLALSPFGPVVPNPWGPMGDLRLMADPETEVQVDLWDDATRFHLFLCDAVETDGRAWECCPRSFLKAALADLEEEAGIRLLASFEQEFHLSGFEAGNGGAFSLERFRLVEPFGPLLVAGLRQAGTEPEVFMTEYGPSQFEITCRPALGVSSADRAVIVREVTREVARRLGHRASFSPLVDPDVVGNGVHVHMSFQDGQDRPLLYDGGRPGKISEVGGSFVAGILRHLPALTALTAPSVVSSARLTPHHWSAAYTAFGVQNREAAMRICPVIGYLRTDPARQFNIEYRAADGAACPHLCLAAIVRAGLAGIRAALPTPPLVERDPEELDESERRRLDIRRLPSTLEAALNAVEADAEVRSWFPDDMWSCYLSQKRFEIEFLEGLDLKEMCSRYQSVY